MFFLKAIYCRLFQICFRLDLPMRYLPYTSRLNQWLIRLFLR